MKVEIWSDVICPWCYIGKRRFEAALKTLADRAEIDIEWRSFELDPQAPVELGETLTQMLARKYGVSKQQADAMNAEVSQLAAREGLNYNLVFARPGNTFNAHRLIHYAASLGRGDVMTERLMHGYFTESLPIGDIQALTEVAVEAGFERDAVTSMFSEQGFSQQVRDDQRRAAHIGIRGVPFFLFDGRLAVSGAQSVDVFVQALTQAS